MSKSIKIQKYLFHSGVLKLKGIKNFFQLNKYLNENDKNKLLFK